MESVKGSGVYQRGVAIFICHGSVACQAGVESVTGRWSLSRACQGEVQCCQGGSGAYRGGDRAFYAVPCSIMLQEKLQERYCSLYRPSSGFRNV